VSGVDITQRIIWLKGERCSAISLIKQPYHDVFSLILLLKAVRLTTPRSVHHEAVLESVTTS
jgi:hypothetical protein